MGKPNQQTRHRRAGGTTHQSQGSFGQAAGGGQTLNDGDDPYDDHDHGLHDHAAHDQAAHGPGDDDADVDFADPHAVRTHHDGNRRSGYDDPHEADPHDAEPPEPGAYDDPAAAGGDRYATTNRPGGDGTRPADGQDDQWGFPKEKRGMSTETKIGLALVVLLLGTFGFVVWKKMQHRDNAITSTYEDHGHGHDHVTASAPPVPPPTPPAVPSPTPPPAPVPIVQVGGHDHGHAHDHPIAEPPRPEPVPVDVLDEWANIEQTSRRTTPRTSPRAEPDPFGEVDVDRHPAHNAGTAPPGRAAVGFGDDFAEFEAPREIPREQPRRNDLPEYEFEADLFAPREQPTAQHAHRHDVAEPGRLEVVDLAAFGDPRVKPAAAQDCPTTGSAAGSGFDARQKPVPQRTGSANDGWGDFTTVDQRPPRPQPAPADCPLDDGWGNPVSPRPGHNTGHQLPPSEFCPVEPVPTATHPPIDANHPAPTLEGGYPAGTRIYTVQNGDNYWTISRSQYGTAGYFSALAQYNADRIPDPKRMRPGMKVVVPPAVALHTRYPKLCGNGTHTVARQNSEPAGFFVGADGSPKYRIGETDTLSDIAHAHLGRASRWVQIYELNRTELPRPETLRVGTVLDLPRDASSVRLVRTAETYR